MMRSLIFSALLLMPVAGNAETAMHTISWYMQHPAVLYGLIPYCHDSAAREDTPDCRNIEAAADGLFARSGGRGGSLAATLNDPHYWANNPIARNGAIIQCGRRQYGDEDILPWCAAIARSYSVR